MGCGGACGLWRFWVIVEVVACFVGFVVVVVGVVDRVWVIVTGLGCGWVLAALGGFAGSGCTADPTLFSLVLWNLWNRRNNLRLEKSTLSLDKILEHSRERQLESHSSPIISAKQRKTQSTT
nr:hypothetical protein CFP56_31278 [Quercus suber]